MFDRLAGNNRIKETLISLLSKKRVPNALIFAGESGIGKRQFAIELAKALLCTSAVEHQSCGECSVCRRVSVFAFPKPDDKDEHKKVIFSEHPDVGTVIPYNRNVLIDAIRALEAEAHFRPYEGAARVFIIDDADKMNDSASNALLKTLEEPAPTSHIFLITARADSLLSTIRSRSQILRFGPVSTNEVSTFLSTTNKFLPEDLPLVSRIAAGSIGRAMETDAEKLKRIRESMINVVEHALLHSDRAELLRIAETLNDAKHKNEFEDHLGVLKILLHDLLLLKSGSSMDNVVNGDIVERLRDTANAASMQNLIDSMEEIERLQGNLIVNVNRKAATDALFLSMTGG